MIRQFATILAVAGAAALPASVAASAASAAPGTATSGWSTAPGSAMAGWSTAPGTATAGGTTVPGIGTAGGSATAVENAAPKGAPAASAEAGDGQRDGGHWVGTWASAQVRPGATGLSATGFADQTVRDIVHTSAGGQRIRIRLSNVFGASPLAIGGVRVAVRRQGAATVAGTTRRVTFGGRKAVTIPAGARRFSDPVGLSVGAGTDLAVSIYFRRPTGPATWHPDAIGTNYYSARGDHSADTGAGGYTGTDTSWYFLDGVDVLDPSLKGSVVTFGPSTTDGDASTPNANRRYPDDLARRLLALPEGQRMSVLNAGISGNELLSDGTTNGQSALHRFLRDAIDQSGVRSIVVWEGTNDIGNHPDLTLGDFTGAYQRLISVAHAYGIRVIGATLQPDEGAGYWTPEGNVLREAVNHWILTSGAFDATADFSTVLQDPANPARLLPAYDSGDHLHPNDAGYQAIADSVDLPALTR